MRDERIFGHVDIELVFLGACMTDEEVLADSVLVPDDFAHPKYATLFERMKARQQANLGVSQLLMSEDMPNLFDEIWSATDLPAELLLAREHERTILDHAARRRLKVAAIRINSMADDPQLENVVDRAKAEVDAVAVDGGVKVSSMRDDAKSVLAAHRVQVDLVPSPWREMNDTLGGFGPGRMYVVGARPGVGKSAVASQIAYELASHGPVVFATMEMDKGEVYSRIVAQQAGIYYGGMKADMTEFLAAREERWLAENVRDIRVLDSGTQTVAGIRAAVRSANRDSPVAGVIVDYIHLLTTSVRIDNEANRIADLTRSLKQLAMDFKIPVIALSQLNREVTSRDSGRPGLRDLRGSGAIEQDADSVIFLYRDGDESADSNRLLSVYVAKNRQGPAFVGFDLEWQGEFVRAVDR